MLTKYLQPFASFRPVSDFQCFNTFHHLCTLLRHLFMRLLYRTYSTAMNKGARHVYRQSFIVFCREQCSRVIIVIGKKPSLPVEKRKEIMTA